VGDKRAESAAAISHPIPKRQPALEMLEQAASIEPIHIHIY
jgi:hypothetical protein